MNVRVMSRCALLGALLLVLAAPAAFAAAERKSGVVRVINLNAQEVAIYVQEVDFYGVRRWKALKVLPPRSFIELPGVPEGTVLRAAVQGGAGVEWPPFTVQYPPERTLLEITLTPPAE